MIQGQFKWYEINEWLTIKQSKISIFKVHHKCKNYKYEGIFQPQQQENLFDIYTEVSKSKTT